MLIGGIDEPLQPPKSEVQTTCERFQDIRSFSDLAEVIFSLDGEDVRSVWNFQDQVGEYAKSLSYNKFKWLMTDHQSQNQGWWIFDDAKKPYHLEQIIKAINPSWEKGQPWIGDLNDDEKKTIIKHAWEKTQDARAQKLAKKLDGTAVKLTNPSMETGVSSIIILNNKPMITSKPLYRGVHSQDPKSLASQVSGMLRTGSTEEGSEAAGHNNRASLSEVITDEEIRAAVYQLAVDPNEEQFSLVLDLYKAKGYDQLVESTKDALGKIKQIMVSRNVDFADALVDCHTRLFEGIIGYSPFIATAVTMGATSSFTGNCGMVIASVFDQQKISNLKTTGREILIHGWINPQEVVAVIPVNRFYGGEVSSTHKTTLEHAFDQYGQELEDLLKSPAYSNPHI